MLRSMLFVVTLAACGADDVHIIDPDAVDAAGGCDGGCVTTDAGADGPDALGCAGTCDLDAAEGGLPVNAACEPTLDQCADGLTCRIRAAHDGLCRPVGTKAAGDLCTSVDQCGDDMACITAEPGALRCMVVCDVAAPSPRCGTATCAPFWGADTGVCT